MTKNLDVTISIDMDAATLVLRPAGSLTDRNVHGIVPVVRRAERALADFDVSVDLGTLHCASPGALDSLHQAGVRTIQSRRPEYLHICRFHSGQEAAA